MNRAGCRSFAVGLWLLVGLAPPGLRAQGEASELDALRSRVEAARASGAYLVAPRALADAVDRLDDAARRLEDGRVDRRFRERLAEGLAHVERAERTTEAARERLAETFASRDAALDAGAPERAAEAWRRAESEFEDAGRRFERGDAEDAERRSDVATRLYAAAATEGWRAFHLTAALTARADAVRSGAETWAPTTFGDGERLVAEADGHIARGATGDPASSSGAAARRAFERAREIAVLADSVRRREVPLERLLLTHEEDVAALAAVAGLDAPRGHASETAADVGDELRRLQSEVLRLEGELDASERERAALVERAAGLEDRLADSERRFSGAREELLERRRRADRIREAQGLFSPDEAEVFLVGERLVLRLLGLTFESGSAEVLDVHEPLLTKVQRVITSFEGASVRIEGHTDSRGRAPDNQALSQRRAIAIREYLLSRIPIPSSRVEAVGLGEEQPIASNESEEGRARNRRTEVVLTLPGTGT